MKFSSRMEQVNKSSYFASANDVLMTKITKLKPELVFQYGFRSLLQHRNTVNIACAIICICKINLVEKLQNKCKKLSFYNNV